MRGWIAVRFGLVVAAVLVGGLGLSACENHNLLLTVNRSVDLPDADPGDGVCEATPGMGDCTLRAAVDEGNVSPQTAQISVAAAVQVVDLDGGVDDANASGDLDVHPASGLMIIQRDALQDPYAIERFFGDDGIFDVQTGGLIVDGAFLTGPTHSTAVKVRSGASVALWHSAIAQMDVGIEVDAGGVASTAGVDDAVAIQTSGQNVCCGPAVVNHGTFTAELSSFRGQVVNDGTFTSSGSILQGPSGEGDPTPSCAGPITSAGYNVTVDESCELHAPSDLVTSTGLFDGRLAASFPAPGSPEVDSIPQGTSRLCDGSAVLDVDQQFVGRPKGAGCDRGAIEYVLSTATFTVDSPLDQHDAAPGDSTCATESHHCTLRAAADEIDASSPRQATIVLQADPTLSIPGAGETANRSGDIDLSRVVTLEGNGHTIDAHQVDRAIATTADLTLEDVTITGGSPPADSEGGGVLGRLVIVQRSTITGNHVTITAGTGRGGGGVAGENVEIEQSTVSANTAAGQGYGGGIAASLTASFDQSTVADNVAGVEGGGFYCALCNGAMERSTIHHNTAPVAAAGTALPGGPSGFVELNWMTVTDNIGGSALRLGTDADPGYINTSIVTGTAPVCYRPVQSYIDGQSVMSDASCGTPSIITSDAQLGPLARNGGSTANRLPAVTSPAVDLDPTCRPTDQRDEPSPAGVRCDAGSVERQASDP